MLGPRAAYRLSSNTASSYPTLPAILRHWPREFGASATCSDSGPFDLEHASERIGPSLTQSGPTAASLCRCAKVVDGGVGRRVEPEDRSGACDAALSLQCAILIHVEWRIFPEYVGGGDQFMLRHRARWQGLAGKQPQGERQHVVAVAVHVVGD